MWGSIFRVLVYDTEFAVIHACIDCSCSGELVCCHPCWCSGLPCASLRHSCLRLRLYLLKCASVPVLHRVPIWVLPRYLILHLYIRAIRVYIRYGSSAEHIQWLACTVYKNFMVEKKGNDISFLKIMKTRKKVSPRKF